MKGYLGNKNFVVKPWYLPLDFVWCRISVNYKTKIIVVRNSKVHNVANLPVEIKDGKVIGQYII